MLDKDPKNINGGCEIGGHNKMARGTEDRERKNWEQHRVKPGNDGHASNPCVRSRVLGGYS